MSYNFKKWDEILFKFNRSVLEDDWNKGQWLQLKDTRKAHGVELGSTAKVSERSEKGSHNVVIEEKLVINNSEILGGISTETKFKNNGNVDFKNRSGAIRVS